MPTATYIALQNITLSSNQTEVTFSSIPATYRDLVLIYNGTNSNSAAGMEIYLNNDTGNRSWAWMIADTGGYSSGTSSVFNFFGTTDRTASILNIMDYSATDKHKTLLWRDNVDGAVRANAGRWASTAAVTSVKIARTAGQTIQTGSTFALYGIVS
jgi:hypothetical protein